MSQPTTPTVQPAQAAPAVGAREAKETRLAERSSLLRSFEECGKPYLSTRRAREVRAEIAALTAELEGGAS